jgi:hypothetical protein
MYHKSKFMLKRFSAHIDKLPNIIEELNRKLDITIKCYVHSQLITNEALWSRIKPILEGESIGEIVVKAKSEMAKRRQEEK